MLYVNFAMVQYPIDEAQRLMYASLLFDRFGQLTCFLFVTRPTLSYQRLQTERPLSDQELHDRIRRTVLNKQDLQVLESFLIFNKYAFSVTRHLRN
jgi:glutamate dehydrogenase